VTFLSAWSSARSSSLVSSKLVVSPPRDVVRNDFEDLEGVSSGSTNGPPPALGGNVGRESGVLALLVCVIGVSGLPTTCRCGVSAVMTGGSKI
jgi:hypothetical protein